MISKNDLSKETKVVTEITLIGSVIFFVSMSKNSIPGQGKFYTIGTRPRY